MTYPGYNLVWHDEFDGPAGAPPNPSHWKFELGGSGWGNAEWQYYTDLAENASMDGHGCLAINALAVPDPENSGLAGWYGPARYTSARLLTADRYSFTYGLIEARIKTPFGQGMWPAFWMLGANIHEIDWPNCGEIDIMETIGREPGKVYGTAHGPGYSEDQGIGKFISLPGLTKVADNFHTFGVDWQPELIRWLFDGKEYTRLTPEDLPVGTVWVFDHPFFVLLNVAVGGRWPGYPDETTLFPQRMLVDYVRLYQRS